MEETKLNDPLRAQITENLEITRWQFQSDSNPYQQLDSVKWIWQNYSNDDNLIIEEAYLTKQKLVNLKDYEIDLKKMLQVCIHDKNKVRRIRRQEPSRFRMEIPEAKDQKTMNEAFGTVQHFLEYIMKRTPEAYTLYQRLGKLSLDCNRNQFEDLVHQVLVCIEKGAEARAKIIKIRTGSQTRDFIREAKTLMRMMEKNSVTLRDFLKAILKTYTMETFICYWLNELLRSEDWEEINVLTPYLVCLVYTFKLSDYVLQSQNSQNTINDKLGFVVKHKLYLYRGAALTEKQLLHYNPNKIKYFSWNSVTSTSRDRNIARNFISLNNVTNIGVIFFIEIDFDSLEDYHGMIDVSKDSRFPKEQEVILAPGTVFQLLEISLVENEVYEIRLKVTKNVKETQEEVALLGVLQNKAISKDKAVIDGLPTQKGFRTLELLRGNKLIRELEIKNSGIEEHIMQEIENMRKTTNVQKQDVKLTGNSIAVSNLSTLVHYFSLDNLKDILNTNQIRFGRTHGIDNNGSSQIKHLFLTNNAMKMFRNSGQLKELWERLKNESQITEISLSIENLQIEEDEFRDVVEGIKEINSLENLTLELNENQLSFLEKYQATSLSLKLAFSEEGLKLLPNTFRGLGCLKSLDLNCSKQQVSDEGLVHLSSALMSLTYLQRLSLNFYGCLEISDNGLRHLKSGLKSLTSLQYFSLNFAPYTWMADTGPYQISDDGLYHLKSGLESLMLLQHLSLNFEACKEISNEGLNHLSNRLTSLGSLQHLSLDFTSCSMISDEGLNCLSCGLMSLRALQSLSLNFTLCRKIMDEGLSYLKSSLKSLKSLHQLSLNFGYCKSISDEGLAHLSCGLMSLGALQCLSLHFGSCDMVSDEGLAHLSYGFISLTSLIHLSLNLSNSKSISNEGLNNLRSGLKSLTFLQHLSLNLNYCRQISDEGLNQLSNGLISLASLQHLSLSLKSCGNKISKEGINRLKEDLKSIPSLKIVNPKGADGDYDGYDAYDDY